MKIAKKSILSLWKATKGLLSAIRQKRQKRKEKSWRNIAKGNESLSLRQASETTVEEWPGENLSDEEILDLIDKIEFDFGGVMHTVGEARPLFIYDMGLDFENVYIIALTINFGTIVFNLTDDLVWIITGRTSRNKETYRSYLSRLIEDRAATYELASAAGKMGITLKEAAEAFSRLAAAGISNKETRNRPANNWLKLHGLPMRRKGKGKKKHEQMAG